MKKFIEKLHFITHDLPGLTHIAQAALACEAGAKWIQYRCLSKNDPDLLEDIHAIAALCDDWGATLIVTDHIRFNGQADIQGFHIEDMDADFSQIRSMLGEAVTLGGSANTLEGLLRLAAGSADYAGCGPFGPTITKPNDLPLLTLQDYSNIITALQEQGTDLPVLAVGGITVADAAALMDTGISGIAVSAAVNRAADPVQAYREFYDITRALF